MRLAAWSLMIIAAVVQQHAAGQDWEKDIEFGVLGGMEWNVFHSPETYVDNNGVLFPSDSIV